MLHSVIKIVQLALKKTGGEYMESQEQLKEEAKKSKSFLEKDSIQFNEQDLDQEQRVDVNPVQLNSQNFHVHINNENYSAKITGVTFMEETNKIVSDVAIQLFLGHEHRNPIFQTNSDINGNFMIDDIPPGYYTLVAKTGRKYEYQAQYFVKVLPFQNADQSIFLKLES